MAEFLGLPPHMVAALPPADPGAAFAVSGFAGLPPHGHPSTGRQCLYVNGHLVKDALVTRWVLAGSGRGHNSRGIECCQQSRVTGDASLHPFSSCSAACAARLLAGW